MSKFPRPKKKFCPKTRFCIRRTWYDRRSTEVLFQEMTSNSRKARNFWKWRRILGISDILGNDVKFLEISECSCNTLKLSTKNKLIIYLSTEGLRNCECECYFFQWNCTFFNIIVDVSWHSLLKSTKPYISKNW